MKQQRDKGAQGESAYTGPTMSTSKSPCWRTTAAINKNNKLINEKVKSFLAPKMQGTAEFCSTTDKRDINLSHKKVYKYGLFEDQQADEEEQVFQESEDYK